MKILFIKQEQKSAIFLGYYLFFPKIQMNEIEKLVSREKKKKLPSTGCNNQRELTNVLQWVKDPLDPQLLLPMAGWVMVLTSMMGVERSW